MSDDEKHLRETIRVWVWGGFYDKERAVEHLDDLFANDPGLTVDKEGNGTPKRRIDITNIDLKRRTPR